MNVKFKDLKWITKLNGSQAILKFQNSYGVSVLFGEQFYSNGVNTFELAVLKNDFLHYENKIANGDVIGLLKKKELMKLINEVKHLKK